MDAKTLNGEIRNQLDYIKDLFSNFVAVTNQIKVTHLSTIHFEISLSDAS